MQSTEAREAELCPSPPRSIALSSPPTPDWLIYEIRAKLRQKFFNQRYVIGWSRGKISPSLAFNVNGQTHVDPQYKFHPRFLFQHASFIHDSHRLNLSSWQYSQLRAFSSIQEELIQCGHSFESHRLCSKAGFSLISTCKQDSQKSATAAAPSNGGDDHRQNRSGCFLELHGTKSFVERPYARREAVSEINWAKSASGVINVCK